MPPGHKRKASTLWRSPRASSKMMGDDLVSRTTKFTSLAGYLILNMALIFFNKVALGKVPFPYLLTALHAATACVGCHILLLCGYFYPSQSTDSSILKLAAFSVLYTLNIALSNVSLQLVSIPFHQVIRATTPVWTVLIYRLVYSVEYSALTYVSLFPVVAGVGFATYGDYAANATGFALTMVGAILAAVKTVATNRLQTTSQPFTKPFAALELLYKMSPLAMFESLCCAYLAGETNGLYQYAAVEGKLSSNMLFLLLVNGILAFCLNIASFTTNKTVGALTMTVATNVKQIIGVILSVLVFRLDITTLNIFGIMVASFGGALYSKAEMAKSGPVRDPVDMLEARYEEKR